MKKINSFTLSEVLITLVVIGIVAALTVPLIISNYTKKSTAVKLQKTYSAIENAFKLAALDYGNSLDWDWSNKEYALKTYLGNYFNVVKYYGPETYHTPMCPEEQVTFYNTATYGWLTNVFLSSPFHLQNNYSFLTNDGVCIGLGQSQTDGKHYIYIDINSSIKGPNKAGKDLFIFVFVNGTIKPWGYAKEDISSSSIAGACNKNASSGGGYCAEKIIRDGWEIKY